MEIVDIAVKDLVPYDKNPRRNDEAAVKVAESIKQFGIDDEVIFLIPAEILKRCRVLQR